MLGIATGWVCGIPVSYILFLSVISLVALLLGLMRIAPKWLFGVGVMAAMFAIGLFAENRQAAGKSVSWNGFKNCYTANLVEMPAVRGTNVKVLADVVADSLPDEGRSQGLVYLYFPRTVETELLSAGDVVTFESKIAPPRNMGNPAEFDIESYYYIKGVSGTAYVPDRKWHLLPEKKNTLQSHALKLRGSAIELYKRLGFEKEALALLSALTLGEKRDFPQELKESYSVAGASHILALSGLHLGILYILLALLVPGSKGGVAWRVLRELFIVLFLWGFAFVAGLSPSVVRSAILFTLMSLGRLLGGDVSPVSSLSLAAMVMLVFSPHLLFDVSFQLSFAAVLSIVLLAPPLQKVMGVYKHGAVYRYAVNLLILSLVAQIGVLPFVWYYFGMFPLYFLVTNIFVVPLAFVMMVLVVAVWILTPLSFLQIPFAWLLGLVVRLMNFIVCGVAELPGASISLPQLDLPGVCCVTVIMVLMLLALYKRHWWLLVLSSCGALSLSVLYLAEGEPADEGDYIVIYNNRKNPLLHLVYETGNNYLVSTVPQLDAEYEYVSEPYIQRESLSSPQWVEWEYSDSLLQYKEGFFTFDGVTIKLLDNSFWRENDYVQPVDVLVLCRGFLGSIAELVQVYPAACVVADASLYKNSRERIMREYMQLGIEVVDVSQTGAMKLVAHGDAFDLIPMKEQ